MFEILGDTYNATAVAAILLFKEDCNFQVVLYGAASDDYIMYDADVKGREFDEDDAETQYRVAVKAWKDAAGGHYEVAA